MSRPIAKFAFRSPELDVEFEGHPDFIRGQIDFLKDRVASIIASAKPGPVRVGTAEQPRVVVVDRGAVAVPTVAAASVTTEDALGSSGDPDGDADAPLEATSMPAGPAGLDNPTLEQFYRRARSREGRGALQETILIFAYFLRTYRDKEEFSIENLNACFSLVGAAPPKSLANTLGIMKRTQKFFASGSQRGNYTLTETGAGYVKRLIGA